MIEPATSREGVAAGPFLALRRSDALIGHLRYREALSVATRALGTRPNDEDIRARLRIVRGHCLWLTGRVGPGRAEVLKAARAAVEPLTRARVEEALGLFAWIEQRLDTARGHLRAAHRVYAECGSLLGQARVLDKEASVLADKGWLGEALHLQDSGLEAASRAGRPDAVAQARVDRGRLLLALGRWSEAREDLDAAAGIFRGLSDPRERMLAGLRQAQVDLAVGGLDEAEHRLEQAHAESELDNPGLRAEILLLVSDLRLLRGEIDAADLAAAEALGLFVLVSDCAGECRSRIRRTETLVGQRRVAEAIREGCRAVRLAPVASPGLRAQALLARGQALLRSGRREEADTAFADALVFSEGRSELTHMGRLGRALARAEGPSRADVSDALSGLETWGDRRLLARARDDALAAHAPVSRDALGLRSGLPATTVGGGGGPLVEVAVALCGAGDLAERWAAAMRVLHSAWPLRRTALLGPEGGWELRDGQARLTPLAPGDIAHDLRAHWPGPGVLELRGDAGLRARLSRGPHRSAWALVAPVPPEFALYVETEADPADPGALGLEAVLAFARLFACHVPPAAAAPEEMEPAFPGIVGRCPALKELFATMARVAPSEVSLHIFGETGTGKEKVARALHLRSARARGPFLPLNASSLSDDLFEAEMFGHVRGAFTGAVADRSGHVAEADGGTLFIDEVAELSLRAQARLLRFLQEGEYRRVGESALRRTDVRVLTAANVDLEQRVASGRFREDLLYRINVVTLRLPPLRERGDDVLLLARHFLRGAAERAGLPTPRLPSELATALVACPWPGNVRQLENEMSRLVTLAGSGPLRREHLSPRVGGPAPPPRGSLKEALQVFERDHVGRALARNRGHRSRTAGELGITRQALGEKIRRLGL